MSTEPLQICEKLAGSPEVTVATDLNFEKIAWAGFVHGHGLHV
ncbi:MAG: hypothetical protein QE267_03000 [Akkermansiaceae bacterium]|nr:hypothetical protein [Akkermansiaceae bacterium]